MPFFVHLDQEGGCDYSIACGERLEKLPDTVKTMQEAVEEVTRVIDSDDGSDAYEPWQLGCYSEPDVESATIFEVVALAEVDVDAFKARLKELIGKKKKKRAEEKERKQLEELKKKYEGS